MRPPKRNTCKAFWEQGFEETSIDDLVDATGIKRGSLYNAFGDKEKMFHLALDRYADKVGGPVRRALLQGDDVRESVRSYLFGHIELLAKNQMPRGCMVTNACVELAHKNDSIGRRMKEAWMAYESDFYQALLRGQSSGQLSAAQDLRALARFLHGTIRAMVVTHQVSGDISAVKDIATVALRIFETSLSDTERQSSESV